MVRDRIGQGGFAAVYRAEQPLLAREAVIKILHARHRSNEAVIQRFLREARLASRLDHPYAAHIYAFGAEPDGLLWIAMELVRGTPLDRLLRDGPLSLERFVPLLDRLCEVVHTAHEAGIVHRDIKPANVMVLARAGRLLPKLLDLGIAKLAGGAPPPAVTATPEARRPEDETSPEAPRGRAARPDETMEVAPPAPRAEPPSPTPDDVRLTDGGAMIGSPTYMAPEQWSDPVGTDTRADLYALGVLTFEALTGRVPFDAVGLDALARAHAEAPVPPLGPGFPPGLDAVLARALAKAPADRFTSALELSAAVRAAAGLESERAPVPRLDEVVRNGVLTEAPQPIAEAVAALDAAKSVHEARDALWEVVHVVARWLALVALACRSRLGPDGGDGEPVREALRALHRRALTDPEWLELARELCRPFAARRDAHPIPELVELLCDARGSLSELVGRGGGEGSHAAGTESQVRERLSLLYPPLAELLGRIAFFAHYPLVVPRAGIGELWMGVRRLRRAPTMLRSVRPLPAGEPVLLDRDGAPVVLLAPLVQVAAPAPGEPEELFLLEGKGRHGARLVAAPRGFERHDDGLWDWFGELLGDAEERTTRSDEARPPYRGLAPFTPSDAADFHGRERETTAFVNRLRAAPLLAVVGPSGAGKSSFVQAGVIPSLPAGWRAVVVRPGSSPCATLEARLAGAPAGETLVVVVDQLEELFTLCDDPAERVRYAEALARQARSADDPRRVVLTVRDDFLGRVGELAPLRDRLTHALQILTTPLPDDLVRILVEPARRAGYELEDPELPARMVAEVAGQPGALALLSFTASRLWELRDRRLKQLPRRAYDTLGGVGGALGRHAEETLAQLLPDEQKLAREAFRHLVTAEGTRAVLSRRELTDLLGGSSVIEKLVAARLLVVSDEGSIEIIHEALLSAWPRLVRWRREDAEGARLRDQLRAAARQWEDRGRPSGLLWRNEALTEYRLWRARHPGALTASEDAFAAASLADAARGRRRRRLALGAAFTGLVAALAVLYALNDRAEVQRARAVESSRESASRLAALYAEQGRQHLLGNDALGAIVYLNEAYQGGHDTPALRWLIGRARRMLERQLVTLEGHEAVVRCASFEPTGARIVTCSADGTARVWEASSGRELARLEGHQGAVLRAEITARGDRVFTLGEDGTVRVWETATGRPIVTLTGHAVPPRFAVQSPDGEKLLTSSVDGTARLWDARTGSARATLVHGAPVRMAQFDAGGSRIATAGVDGVVRMWDAATGRLLLELRAHDGPLFQVAFSPTGETLATTGVPPDATLRLFSLPDGAERAAIQDFQSPVIVRFSADGKQLVASSNERTARIYDTTTGVLQFSLAGHEGPVTYACFSPDGTRIATTSADGTASVWHARSGTRLLTLAGHVDTVWVAAFDASGRRLVTTGWDATARIWDVSEDDLLLDLPHPAAVTSAALDRTGATIATTDEEGTVRLWEPTGGLEPLAITRRGGPLPFAARDAGGTLAAIPDRDELVVIDLRTRAEVARLDHGAPVTAAAFLPAGRAVVTAGSDGRAHLWDLPARAITRTYAGDEGPLLSVALSDDGAFLATGGEDRAARVWETATGRTVALLGGHLRGVRAVAFDAGGTRVATASERTARLWKVDGGAPIASFRGHGDDVVGATISPDGHFLLTASDDGTARVWDSASGEVLGIIGPHGGYVTSAIFSGDGRRILTTSRDRSAKIWNLEVRPVDREDVARLARCAPWTLVGGRLLPAATVPCTAAAREAQPSALRAPRPVGD